MLFCRVLLYCFNYIYLDSFVGIKVFYSFILNHLSSTLLQGCIILYVVVRKKYM